MHCRRIIQPAAVQGYYVHLYIWSVSLADRGEFGDLAIWGGLSLILAAFYIVCAIKTRQRNADNDGEAI